MAKVIDPVCGMEIDTKQTAIQSKFEGHTYFFCSTICAREFEKHPREVLERHEPPFTTKGIFTAPKFGSAGSGGAEYELLPEAHDDKKDRHEG
jgi:YHS domain-containing protein